ncbi:protein WHAT'S THIS FACTOR 9, mitochondrial [Aristolochia californica]|uniref:protein WHAT'S THIS FACTOR 9, mitochondrial n=1 Tax=Aristolochia californica TaxID=171875 RepID=UPI0035E00A65
MRQLGNLAHLASFLPYPNHNHHFHCRHLVRVRLKWVKNRSLDHIIDIETDLKAACLLKDVIKRSSHGYLSARILSPQQKLLGLTVPVLRFLRRYPTLFQEFSDPKYSNLPCFRLTDTARFLDSQEQAIHQTNESDIVERLSRFLMMSNSKQIPLQCITPLKWDLGLPDDYVKTIVPKFPNHFQVIKRQDRLPCLGLVGWREEFAVSTLQRNAEISNLSHSYRDFKRGTSLAFPMNFPRGYGSQKKVRAWMDEFQKLPYISPYENSSQIDPDSDLMEKHVVGVLHELLSLTIHKKTKRNYLRCLREEFNLPHKFTRVFTRYPGIFYLSLKCKTTTVSLKEGYQRGKLVDPHPLARIREKYYYVMRTGIMYRGKGDILLPEVKDLASDQVERDTEDEVETEDECELESGSEFDTGSEAD